MVDEFQDVRVRVRGPLAADDPHVLTLLRESFLDPPSNLPYNLSPNPKYQKGEMTWEFIHQHMKKLLGGKRGGFFVEAGALDGEKGSNTLWLELELGWTGLLVEPDPSYYAKVVNKRRRVWSSHTCLSPHPYPQELILVSVGRKRIFKDKHFDGIYTSRGLTHLVGYTLEAPVFDDMVDASDKFYSRTQCFPLVSYLMALNVSTVDFFSLDVQGVERRVLEHIPWDKVVIRSLVIEVSSREVFQRDFKDFMEKKNYTLVAQGKMDYIYVRNGDPFLQNVDAEFMNISKQTDE